MFLYSIQQMVFLVASEVHFCEVRTASSQVSMKSSEGYLGGLLRRMFRRIWMTDLKGASGNLFEFLLQRLYGRTLEN